MEINSNNLDEIFVARCDRVEASKDVKDFPESTGIILDKQDIKQWTNNENI